MFVYLDDEYPKKPVDIDVIIAASPTTYSKHPDGSLCIRLHNPAGDDAHITDSSDLELITKLMDIATTATPLNPAHKAALEQSSLVGACTCVKLGETQVMVDTEHYQIDARAHIVFKPVSRVGLAQLTTLGSLNAIWTTSAATTEWHVMSTRM